MPLQFIGYFRRNMIKIASIINTFVAIFSLMYTNIPEPIDIRVSKPQEELGA